MIACSLGRMNKIKTTSLLDTRATGIAFINLAMACHVCDILQIFFIQLAKPKLIRRFDGKLAPLITHAIYPTLTVQSHTELLASFLITKLGQHLLILGKPWMQKHGIILDMSCDKLTFWPRHCQHPGSLLVAVNTPVESHLSTSVHLRINAIMLLAPDVDNPTTSSNAPAEPQNMHTKAKNSKKSKKLNAIKTSQAIPGMQPTYQGVSKLADKEGEKYVIPVKRILKPATIPKPKVELADETKPIDLAFIGETPFTYLAKQKNVEIFAISIRDIEYQLEKATKTPMDLKTVVLKEYHEFLDVFSKEASDTLSEHSKYDHKIWFLEGYKNHGNSPLRAMSEPKLQFMKKFVEVHLKKGFIKASSAPCLSSIMLTVKLGRSVQFCVDYRRLNEFTVKDAYPIPLIKETLVQLKNAKVLTKIDIQQVFYKLRMAVDLEDYTTFSCRFGAFKWKILPFGLTGGPASWQHFINDVLWEYLNRFCTAYLDNILIYSSNLKEHKEHMRLVLAKLCEFGIQADVDKCKFHVTKTKYLGLIVSTKGIKIDLAKVAAIRNWDRPTCVKEIRLFIGFCNFYQRFIHRFSNMASPLNAITKKKAMKKQFA